MDTALLVQGILDFWFGSPDSAELGVDVRFGSTRPMNLTKRSDVGFLKPIGLPRRERWTT
jgi:hypothetical protein